MPVMTNDEATNLAFLTNELINRDPLVHQPLVMTKWGEVIKLREGISLSDEYTAYVRSDWGITGTLGVNGIPWITPTVTDMPNVSITGEQVLTPMHLGGYMISYSKLELEKAQRLNINLDQQKTDAMHESYQLAIDKMVFTGDSSLDTTTRKCQGLVNNDAVSVTNSTKLFSAMSDDEKVKAINDLLETAWEATNYTIMPNMVLLPPALFATLATTRYGDNADHTLLKYLEANCLAASETGVAPKFISSRWCNTAGKDKKGRIIAFNNDVTNVRYNMAPIQRMESYLDKGMYYNTPYVFALGEVEWIRPQSAAYLDKVTN